MTVLLGVDTGGTYSDAVLLDERTGKIRAQAKALTSRPDLSVGIGTAINAALAKCPDLCGPDIGLVSLSTTLATNALVEGQGAPAHLILIGFDEKDQARAGLAEAINANHILSISGGHDHSGREIAPLDTADLETKLAHLPAGTAAVAIASSFATRNPAHELQTRDLVRKLTGLPTTCSHELSASLNGPKRALTAVLNARLISMIDGLLTACETHLSRLNIRAPLMVVRGDGALISASQVRERPIETILSGPAASVAGAAWLTGAQTALVSDIGGTTTDVCLLQDGRPAIDPNGATVGGLRTMVEAVAMRTTGLGGDSEIHLGTGLQTDIQLGPLRHMPMALAANQAPDLVHAALDAALRAPSASDDSWRFAFALFSHTPSGLGAREEDLAKRLASGPQTLSNLIRSRIELPALRGLVQRGMVLIAGPTPSDAAHVLGKQTTWDRSAAHKAMELLARKRGGSGDCLAADAESLAQKILDQLTTQSAQFLLETAFHEDPRDWKEPPAALAAHQLMTTALDRAENGLVRLKASLGLPVIGLGASAPCYYPAIGKRLGCEVHIPPEAGVANAIGAVVGQVSMRADGMISSPVPGLFVAHLANGPERFTTPEAAITELTQELTDKATHQAQAAGVDTPLLSTNREDITAEIEGQPMIIEIRLSVTAHGRPRIATEAL